MVVIRQSGNALFLILIAVALFAALSYAITQSGRGSGTTSKEQDILYAGQITQAGVDMKNGVMRMILAGTPESQIEVGATGEDYAGTNGNPPCTSGTTCLFAPDGGGVAIPRLPLGAYYAPVYTGWSDANSGGSPFLDGSSNAALGFSVAGLAPAVSKFGEPTVSGVSSTPVPVVFFSPLTQSVCLAIDKGLGFTSIVNAANTAKVTGITTTPSGLESACVFAAACCSGQSIYIYYQVLWDHD